VDFVHGATAFRRFSATSRKQPLARAIGVKGRVPLTVVDATAGLGRDTFLLACLGCHVIAIERSAVLWALLRDGIDRAATSGVAGLASVMERIQLVRGDAREILATLDAEAIYLDPMFPSSKRTALAKKEMMVCRALLGNDSDAIELLRISRSTGAKRVVVKRHPHDTPLAPEPAVQFRGRTVRYDVYLRI
jgi:16S rRNA (guanine1516-N2)-methyltransferase